jgi:hypothetical protein
VSISARLARLGASLDLLERGREAPAPLDALVVAERIGIKLDAWQREALRSRAQTLLLCCGRQVGKSMVAALLIVAMLLQPERTVVIIAPSERQAKELLRVVLTLWRRLGRPVAYTHATRTSLELRNSSRLEALPASEDTIRGISAVNLLVAEEAAMVHDDLFNSVSPMLAVSNGRLVAPSTPRGRRGWFHSLWSASPLDDPDIERFLITSEECPRIQREFLQRERRRVGTWWFNQEYLCEFLEDEDQLVSDADLAAALSQEVRPLFELVEAG